MSAPVENLRVELARLCLAYEMLERGDSRHAQAVLHLDGLDETTMRYGLKSRLASAYGRAQGRRIDSRLKGAALSLLSGGRLADKYLGSVEEQANLYVPEKS